MKLFKVISTAALALVLGATASVYAQKGQKENGGSQQKEQGAKGGGGQKGQQAQHSQQPQHTQQAQRTQRQPQRSQQAQRTHRQPQRTQQVRQTQRPERSQQAQRTQRQPQRVASNRGNNGFHGNGNNGNHYGRIPDNRYRAHFGNAHQFRMSRPRLVNGYNRFQYSGYWFGYNEPWPSDWYYTDDVYVEYVDSSYYLYNPRHPGIHITLNLF